MNEGGIIRLNLKGAREIAENRAKEHGISVSEYVRSLIFGDARKISTDQSWPDFLAELRRVVGEEITRKEARRRKEGP